MENGSEDKTAQARHKSMATAHFENAYFAFQSLEISTFLLVQDLPP